MAQTAKHLPTTQENWVRALGQGDPLEKKMATAPFQYSCLENPMDGGTWQTTVHRVTKSRTRLSNFTFFLLSYLNVSPALPLVCSV